MTRLLLALLLSLAAATASAVTRESTGTTPGGAAFKIAVPDGWQPGGPLVIVNHGYNFEIDDSPGLSVLAPLLLEQGYAMAASGYRQRGWAVFSALDDNVELVARFTTEFGAPGSLIAVGGSMGGVVTLKMLDDPRFSKLSGAYALCAPADVYGAWDSAFDLRLAYDAVCGDVNGADLPKGDEPYPWALNLDDVPSNLSDFENADEVVETLLPVTICTGLGLNESLRFPQQKERLAALMKFAQVTDEDFFTEQLAYAIFGLADVVRSPDKLGGRSPFDSRYLDRGTFAGSGPDIDARIPVIAPDLFARQLFAQKSLPARIRNPYAPPQVPVVSLYTSKDELVRTYHADSIQGPRTLKARIEESQPSHCGFSEAEVAAGWQALTLTIAGAPVPASASVQAQALQALCVQAQGLGADGGCRIVSSSQANAGKPRTRVADGANVGISTSGLYYDPSRSGEGVLLEILPDNTALAAWFTFPGPGDGGEQKWLIGSGPWAGNGATITPLIAGTGTQFGAGFDPSEITRLQWGSLTIALDAPAGTFGRINGRMRYQGPVTFDPPGTGAGEVAFNQIASFLYSGNIEFSPPLPSEDEFLGTFWNPARSGEGLMLTQDQFLSQPGGLAPRVYALWFTYDLVGNPLWLFGDVTGNDGQYQISFLRPIGTQFGSGFDPSEVVRQPWGTATVSYSDCNHLTLNYDSTQPGFGAGTLTLARLTKPMGASVDYCPGH